MKVLKVIKFIVFIAFNIASPVFGQVIALKFSALSNGVHADIDSVRVTNLTHPGDTLLYWPDTTLVLGYVGLNDNKSLDQAGFEMWISNANPVTERANIHLTVPVKGNVNIKISDITGRILNEFYQDLSPGSHLFHYKPNHRGMSIISASFGKQIKSLKIIYIGNEGVGETLRYDGLTNIHRNQKKINSYLPFIFNIGDDLNLKGWYNGSNLNIQASPQASSNYFFNFYMNVPCPNLTQFTYGGQTYNTVQIGSQCWMKENLNIGTMVNSTITSSSHSDCINNSVIEKYCYNNDTSYCTIYGGLYDWDEMMQYSTTSGTQGICPIGWHIPTDSEWCTMVSYLDPTTGCNAQGDASFIASGKLKVTGFTYWMPPNGGATNESGFSALGASIRDAVGTTNNIKYTTYIWTSDIIIPYYYAAIYWCFDSSNPQIARQWNLKTSGMSVRCIKNH